MSTPPIQGLKVTVHDSSLVFPCQETEKRSMFLSNIDRVLNFNVETVHFFAANDGFPFAAVVEKLRTALSKVLVPYDFFAGRLRNNPATGRLEIDCNAAGVGFVVGSSEYSLDDVGDLVYPNPAFSGLIATRFDFLEPSDQPLFILQLTSFKCGGFAMGISNNHVTVDGLSFKTFLDNLAALAADKPLPVPPHNDRSLLAARSPPRVTFPHPELVKLDDAPSAIFELGTEDLDFKIFRLSPGDISCLKAIAAATTTTTKEKALSGFKVVAAHLWRCKALSGGGDVDRESTMLYAVDLRRRMNPPLPGAYAGNAVVSAYASATRRWLEEGPLGRVVERVEEGACRITDGYARSMIDWGEVHEGSAGGEFLVSSWWRLGLADVEYPWGRPRYSCPLLVHPRKHVVLLFPDIEDREGVNVLVGLPKNDMDKFQKLFHQFLPQQK